MPRHNERTANNALADTLRAMMHGCDIRSESTQTIAGHSGLQPDILITAADRAPVVIEAEFMPAAEVEQDAAKRLGFEAAGAVRKIEAVIALRYPEGIEYADDLDAEISDARLSYCVLTAVDSRFRGNDGSKGGNDESKGGNDGAEHHPHPNLPPSKGKELYDRFPESGWLQGSASDVADLARLVSVPQSVVDEAASVLERGIERAVGVLDEVASLTPAAAREIADLLGMTDVPQTRRMACAVVANAMVFHDRIAILHPQILALNRLWKSDADNPQDKVANAWDAILKINYWPIFAVARDIVNLLPSYSAARILGELRETAQRINSTGANFGHDLTGRIFQRLIVDRKYLATFYTLPASAALLARLAVAKLGGVDWSTPAAIAKLRVGDFACGTGALLSAVYEQLALRHEHAGGEPSALHTAMMEEVLYGCDVMPSAIHITGSTLSGRQPNVGYGNSRLYAMRYGRQSDGTVAIGSLELLQSSSIQTLFNMSDPAMRTGSTGEETAARVEAEIRDEGFDLVIMNPPFTRNTGQEGAHIGVANRAFAAFNASDADQREMGKKLTSFRKGTVYHGNAGIASAFAELGHRKLKAGGVLALVLPLTAAVGLSWQKFRDLLVKEYTDISVLSIAANGKDMSFSSDTGMAECLIVARKLREGETSSKTTAFTSFNRRPQGFAHSAALAAEIANSESVRGIEDGPYGGTPLMVGDEKVGEMLTVSDYEEGEAFAAVRLSDSSLAQTAYALSASRLWLPGVADAVELKMSALNEVGKMGLYHIDINGPAPRGPFDKVEASPTPTYPCLWNHNARNEKRIICEPDSQLLVRQGLEEKAVSHWTTASRCHINRDFTFGSQPLAAAFTERKSIGGRVWPNVIFDDERHDYAFTVWSNSTLGLLSYWWHSSRQQSSKAGMTIRTAETLPILDLRALTDAQLATARDIFDQFRALDLQPAYLADRDPNRALLDRRVLCDLLGFDADVYEGVRLVAAKWCGEPSVHGGKGR